MGLGLYDGCPRLAFVPEAYDAEDNVRQQLDNNDGYNIIYNVECTVSDFIHVLSLFQIVAPPSFHPP